jgi:polar amino acid transport system substrate-binding protein
MSKVVTRFCMPALVLLVLAGCGSSKSKSTASTTESTPSTSVNSSIAAQVPSRYKTKGSLIVATEAQYAPNEFIAPDGHTIIGMDPDLVRALATTMGLRAEFINANFEAIIPGLAAGRYDLGASSFTDTKEREKTVDFVTYFTAGISFYAKTSANPGVKTVADLCGKTVAVEKGTVELEEATKQSGKCTKEGKKAVSVLTFPGQNPVNLAILSGRAEVGMADSPVVAYQIKAERRTAEARRRKLQLRALRAGAPKELWPRRTGARSAQAADGQRHLHADPHQVGNPVGGDQQPEDQRRDQLS